MVKPVIVKRNTKGSALTFTELDTNFQNLDDATITLKAGSAGVSVASDLNGTITLVASDGISFTGNNTTKEISFDASLVQDPSPQLAGNLDVQTYKITTTVTNGNIEIDPPGTGKVIISGDLQVDGTTTTINSTTLDVDDKNITLAKGAANAAAADGGGITVEGPATAATILYEADDDSWNFNKKTSVSGAFVTTGQATLSGLQYPTTDGTANYVLTTNGSGVLSWTQGGKSYTISAESTSAGDAYISLNGSDSTTDMVEIASGTGITVEKTDASTITISRQVYTWDSLGNLTWDDLG